MADKGSFARFVGELNRIIEETPHPRLSAEMAARALRQTLRDRAFATDVCRLTVKTLANRSRGMAVGAFDGAARVPLSHSIDDLASAFSQMQRTSIAAGP